MMLQLELLLEEVHLKFLNFIFSSLEHPKTRHYEKSVHTARYDAITSEKVTVVNKVCPQKLTLNQVDPMIQIGL